MSDLTSDEPYVPAEDADEILEATGATSNRTTEERVREGAKWERPKVHKGESQLSNDDAFAEKVKLLEQKLDRGDPLTKEELQYLHDRMLCRIATSRRPSMVARGIQFIQQSQIKKLLETQPATPGEKTAGGVAWGG